MEEFRRRNSRFQTKESEENGRNFNPRLSDVFIATYPKCGTTWMTQILHSLRSNGDMNFGEITEVAPWDVVAQDCGQDINSDQPFEPRLFKSHERFEDIAKDPLARYVVVCRNPLDAFSSMYKFVLPYMGISLERVTMIEFAQSLLGGASNSGVISSFYYGWLEGLRRYPKNILWVFFEDMKLNLEKEIRRVNDFLGITKDEERIKVSLKCSSFDFMKQHGQQFDDNFVFNHRKKEIGHADDIQRPPVGKVNEGRVGGRNELNEEVIGLLEKDWGAVFGKHGIADYDALVATVKEIQEG